VTGTLAIEPAAAVVGRSPEGLMADKTVIRTAAAPAPSQGAPYSQGVRFGGLVFTAGQIAVDPATGVLVPGGIREQTERVMLNLRAILEAAGSSMEKILKTTVFLTSRDDWAAMNEVYVRHVGAAPPARSAVEVSRLAPGAIVEIEAVAYV
jgi:2-iminobutanoate/2-iminopropanoate deaminase